MRKKETENDYRYFPDPDLPPIRIDQVHLEKIKTTITKLPYFLEKKWKEEYNLNAADAALISDDLVLSKFFENYIKTVNSHKEFIDLFTQKLIPAYKEGKKMPSLKVVNEIIDLLQSGKVSKSAVYSQLIPLLFEKEEVDINTLAEDLELIYQESSTYGLESTVDKILTDNDGKVKEYKKGKKGLIGFFIGQVSQSVGKGTDPKVIKDLIEKKLEN